MRLPLISLIWNDIFTQPYVSVLPSSTDFIPNVTNKLCYKKPLKVDAFSSADEYLFELKFKGVRWLEIHKFFVQNVCLCNGCVHIEGTLA